MSGDTPKKEKKEKKDKKRKSEAADLATEEPIKPEVVPPAAGTASAEAVAMEVDGEKAAKKAKKDKRKSVGGDVAAEEQDAKVSYGPCDVVCQLGVCQKRGWRYNLPIGHRRIVVRISESNLNQVNPTLTTSPSSLFP
jgi:hypothetical protein